MATDKIKVAVRVRPFNRRGLYKFPNLFSFLPLKQFHELSSLEPQNDKKKYSCFFFLYWNDVMFSFLPKNTRKKNKHNFRECGVFVCFIAFIVVIHIIIWRHIYFIFSLHSILFCYRQLSLTFIRVWRCYYSLSLFTIFLLISNDNEDLPVCIIFMWEKVPSLDLGSQVDGVTNEMFFIS